MDNKDRFFLNNLNNIEDNESGNILATFSEILDYLNYRENYYKDLASNYTDLVYEKKLLKDKISELEEDIDFWKEKYSIIQKELKLDINRVYPKLVNPTNECGNCKKYNYGFCSFRGKTVNKKSLCPDYIRGVD